MKFHPLFVVLLLAGTEPIHEATRKTLWMKVNKVGILCCVLQLTLTTFGYLRENQRYGATGHFSNNILRSTIRIKQIFTVCVPIIYIATKFLHLRVLEMFHEKISQFDAMLETSSRKHQKSFGGAVERMEKVSLRLSFLGALLLVLGEVVNIGIGALYIFSTTGSAPEAITFYFYQVTVVNFVGTAFDIGIRLNGVQMRMRLLLDLQEGIARNIAKEEADRRRISLLFK